MTSRWRIQVPVDLSMVIWAESREDAEATLRGIVFETLVCQSSKVEHMEITDFEEDSIWIDPEPLCEGGCGRLPECCDCEDDE